MTSIVMKLIRRAKIACLGMVLAGTSSAQVVINEINYNSLNDPLVPPPFLDSGDWIELHNTTGSSVDVAGWMLRDEATLEPYVIPSPAVIPALGYLVVYERSDKFKLVYPDVTNTVSGEGFDPPTLPGELPTGFGFGGADTVRLSDENDAPIDSVTYLSNAPWTDEPDGLGPTLSLIDPSLDNSLPQNWTNSLVDAGTPGVANGLIGTTPNDSPLPVINSPGKHSFFNSGSTVVIEASVTDDGSVTQVEFFSDAGGADILPVSIGVVTSAPFNLTNWAPDDGSYKVSAVATDSLGVTGKTLKNTFVTIRTEPAPVPLVINEINYNSPDPFEGGVPGFETDDWVEIYNPSGAPVNVGGWKLRDSDFLLNGEFVIPANTLVAAGGYLVLAKDSGKFSNVHSIANFVGENDLPFGYSNNDSVELLDSFDGLVDKVSYKAGDGWPETPDGGGPSLCLDDPTTDNAFEINWSASSVNGGTPGVANGKSTNSPPVVVITSPAAAEQVAPGSAVTIQVTALDDGSITQVEFIADAKDGNGSQILGVDVSAPFAFEGWMPANGFHTIIAVAQDNTGLFNTSDEVGINVSAGAVPALVINEINYNAPDDTIDLETGLPIPPIVGAGDWVEIYNPTAASVNLFGWQFRDSNPLNIPLTLPNISIPSEGYLLFARNQLDFEAAHENVTVSGAFDFNLSGNDEARLLDPVGNLVDSVAYGSLPPWTSSPDGLGPSLSLINPSFDNSQAANWAPSAASGGTPGAANDVGGLTPNAQPFSSITSPSTAAHFVPNAVTNPDYPITVEACAFDFDDGFIASVQFFANNGTSNESIGTDTTEPFAISGWEPGDGAYSLTAMATDNMGATRTSMAININVSDTPPADLIITEINYSSPLDLNADDWVEIYNRSSSPVPLFGWKFRDSKLTRQFIILQAITLQPGAYVVLAKTQALFDQVHSSVSNRIGSFGFGLSGGGEMITLYNPSDEPVNSVTYGVGGAWPAEPAGTGPTLSLINVNSDNTLASNWAAGPRGGTPGSSNNVFVASEDTDMDGMPNVYETANGLNPNADDAAGDLDGDGLTNLEEHIFGTNANDASSTVALNADFDTEGFIGLSFDSVLGKTYHIHGGTSPANMPLLRTITADGEVSRELFDDLGGTRFFFEIRVYIPE